MSHKIAILKTLKNPIKSWHFEKNVKVKRSHFRKLNKNLWSNLKLPANNTLLFTHWTCASFERTIISSCCLFSEKDHFLKFQKWQILKTKFPHETFSLQIIERKSIIHFEYHSKLYILIYSLNICIFWA